MRKVIAGLVLAALSLTAVAAPAAASYGSGYGWRPNIVERLIQLNEESGRFDTLLTAATCPAFNGAIANALSTTQGITLFAPTDRAFADLNLNESNVCDVPAEALADILTYHVIAAVVTFRQAVAASGTSVTMLNGDPAAITGGWYRLYIDGARIIQRDIKASNGLIHVINAVMLPPA